VSLKNDVSSDNPLLRHLQTNFQPREIDRDQEYHDGVVD